MHMFIDHLFTGLTAWIILKPISNIINLGNSIERSAISSVKSKYDIFSLVHISIINLISTECAFVHYSVYIPCITINYPICFLKHNDTKIYVKLFVSLQDLVRFP